MASIQPNTNDQWQVTRHSDQGGFISHFKASVRSWSNTSVGAVAAGALGLANSCISSPIESSESYGKVINLVQMECPTPDLLKETIQLFFKAHIYYKAYQMANITIEASQSQHRTHPAIFGAALQLFGDYTFFGGYAVNAALVAKCVEDLLKEYQELVSDYQQLCSRSGWSYPTYEHVAWQKDDSPDSWKILSPSTYAYWQEQCSRTLSQFENVAKSTAQVVAKAFRISMCLYDAHLLFIGDTQTRFEACTELVANWSRYQEQLGSDALFLINEIERSSQIADRIFLRLGINCNCSIILTGLREQTASWLDSDEFEIIREVVGIAASSLYQYGKNPMPFTPLLRDHQGLVDSFPETRFPAWGGAPYNPEKN